MSSAERAAQLRAQADALDALAGLETDLADAKQAYADDPNEDTKAAKVSAAVALRAARQTYRPEGVTVGGDAYIETEA